MLTTRELEALAKSTGELVRDLLASGIAGVTARLDALEQRLAEIPAGPHGKDGIDGKDGQDGAPGKDGEPGRDGIDGKSITVDDVLPALQEQLQKAIETIPIPKDGEPGKDGRDGVDGKSITLDDIKPLLEAMQSAWALDFERRAQALFQAAIERMPLPKDGKDGVDGLGFDDFDMTYDGRRTFTWKFEKGDQVKLLEFKVPVVLDSGIWKEGNFYEQGDGATFGGSFWIAQKNTDDKPGTSDAWRLAVKKGRDGK